jgi:type I restriction enzyme R subunit
VNLLGLLPLKLGIGQDKQFFYLLDYCQNLEFFKHNPETTDAPIGKSLNKHLFTTRLDLIAELDNISPQPRSLSEVEGSKFEDNFEEPKTNAELRSKLANLLYTEVAAMNSENFVVRPKRRFVEQYANSKSWQSLSDEDFITLNQEIAGLPSQLETEAEEIKRFDILVLKLQLAILRSHSSVKHLREQIKSLAGLLEEKSAIPLEDV